MYNCIAKCYLLLSWYSYIVEQTHSSKSAKDEHEKVEGQHFQFTNLFTKKLFACSACKTSTQLNSSLKVFFFPGFSTSTSKRKKMKRAIPAKYTLSEKKQLHYHLMQYRGPQYLDQNWRKWFYLENKSQRGQRALCNPPE